MKKLMIAFAAVALAVSAQAAKSNWGYTNMYMGDGYADLSGYTAYLVLDADWDTTDVAGSLDKNIVSAPNPESGHYIETDPGKGGPYAMDFMELTPFGGIADTLIGDQDVRIVFSNGEKYVASGVITGSVVADDYKESYTGFASDSLAFAAADLQAVPEPTSGLLLLLGVAGLALRRRRA